MMNVSSIAETHDTRSEILGGGRIKGGIMAAHLDWATKDHDPQELAQFWAALPAHVADTLHAIILPVNWYEFADLIAVERAIVNVFGAGDLSILRSVGGQSARLNLNGVYKAYRRESIHQFLANYARLHRQFLDFGNTAYIETGPRSGEMVHSDYTSYSPLFCESAFGFYAESLRIHRAQSVDVQETTCRCQGDETCTYVLRWS